MSSFRGIIVLFPWRHCPPIRCKVKGLKSEVWVPCCLPVKASKTTDSRHARMWMCLCNVMTFWVLFFVFSSFWFRTLNGINTKVPGLHLVFPWLLKNLSSGFKWSGMQVCFSSLIASYITFSYFFFNVFYSYHFLACPTGSFRVGDYGTLLKKFCEGERECYLKLMEDTLRPFVPTYHGVVQVDEQDYNMMDNLLTHFSTPAVMDCKMGSR